jgi:hypothetical protein
MTDTTTTTTLLNVVTPLLTILVMGIGGILTIAFGRWNARAKLDAMRHNAMDAVQSIEQTCGSEISNEEKKTMALALAQMLNEQAGVKVEENLQLSLNESAVLMLPKKEKKNDTTTTKSLPKNTISVRTDSVPV